MVFDQSVQKGLNPQCNCHCTLSEKSEDKKKTPALAVGTSNKMERVCHDLRESLVNGGAAAVA